MLSLVRQLVESIENSEELGFNIFPMELVKKLSGSSAESEMGKFMLQIVKEKIKFNFKPDNSLNAFRAYEKVKECTTEPEKIYYSLLLVSKYHRITKNNLDILLKRLVS